VRSDRPRWLKATAAEKTAGGGRRAPAAYSVVSLPPAALVFVVLAVILLAPAAAGASSVHLRVTAPVREQEPLAKVLVRVRLTDAAGRGVPDARCTFTWRQAGTVLHRSSSRTARSGRVSDWRVVSRATPGEVVRVTVRCWVRGALKQATTRFVPQPPLPAVPKIVFIGDSLTRGLFASTEAASFRARVSEAVPSTDVVLVSSNGRSDGVDLAQVAATAGDIYVIGLGTNDASGAPNGVISSPEVVAENLRAIVRAARTANADCRIVFLTVWQFPRRRAAYDAEIAALSAAVGLHVVDLGPVKDDPACAGPAGVITAFGPSDAWHPNDAGHAAIALRVTDLIGRLLRLSGVKAQTESNLSPAQP
jgi:acyl-CoA thioesterase I